MANKRNVSDAESLGLGLMEQNTLASKDAVFERNPEKLKELKKKVAFFFRKYLNYQLMTILIKPKVFTEE